MTYIFIGWLLIFLHFNINGFDLLPDFIGYALIFLGVHKFSSRSAYFGRTRIFAVLMGVISFSELFDFAVITIESHWFMYLIAAANVLLMLIPLYMMYLITCGMKDLEHQLQTDLGADTLLHVWKMDMAVTVVFWMSYLLSQVHILPGVVFALTILLTVCILVLNIAWVICFYFCKKRFDTANIPELAKANVPLVQTSSILFALIALLLIFGLLMLGYSEYANVVRNGIQYVERAGAEHYRFKEYVTRDSSRVVIDWNNVEASVGEEIYNDGECSIYISGIQDNHNGGYDIFFKTKGNFGYFSGRMVTPLSHMGAKDDKITLQDIHQNWPNDARLQVTIGDKTYLSEKWCARAQSFDKYGDEIGYPMFEIDYYESGEMILTDEI